MMKKNDVFNIPQRQSQYAIIFIILRSVKRIVMQLWPLLLAFFLGRGGSSFDNFELAISGLGVIGVIPSIIAYYKFYFSLSKDELVITKGLFKKVRLNIPFERIQSVNFRQTAIHQFFKVTEVEIETAGSSEQETKIDALDIPTAEKLRQRILERKQEVSDQDSITHDQLSEDQENTIEPETILALQPKDLIKVGLTQNHLRPVGLLIGAITSVFFYSYTFDYNPMEFFNEIYSFIESLSPLRLVLFMIVLFFGSIIFSIITTYLRYYHLLFWRMNNKFQVVQGLFTRKEFAALDNKIQLLTWGQNPFERLIGFYNIAFKQARSSNEKRRSSGFVIPGCSEEQVEFVQKAWLGKVSSKSTNIEGVSLHYFLHGLYYQLFFLVLIVAALVYADLFTQAFFFSVFMLIAIVLSYINYKKKKYSLNSEELYIGGGTLGLRHSLLPLHKIQDIRIQENPYQWRRNLVTLVIFTAAGHVKIPYITKTRATQLLDFLIYKVESSKKAWM